MKIIKCSIFVYCVIAAIIFIVVFLAASPLSKGPSPTDIDGSIVATIENIDKKIEDLRRETEQLRRWMWGATGKNSRELESLRNTLSLVEDYGGGGEDLVSQLSHSSDGTELEVFGK